MGREQDFIRLEEEFDPKLNPRLGVYTQNVENYLLDPINRTLRPDQVRVMQKVKSFFEEGRTRGYIELPTGTGKTVLFVELSKALLATKKQDEFKPRILVVVPTKDLVHQTLGRTKQKGYGKFAPELKVGSYFSDTPSKEKALLDSFDVVVTTYNSFDILWRMREYPKLKELPEAVVKSRYFTKLVMEYGSEEAFKTAMIDYQHATAPRKTDKFDIFIFDEAHHTLGNYSGEIIKNSLPENKVILGFTATPNANEQRALKTNFPYLIHRLSLVEAISMKLASPIVPIGLNSGSKLKGGSQILNEEGEFIDSRIHYLAEDGNRNNLIIAAAKALAQQNIGTIISCIAGGEAWHTRHLATLAEKKGLRAKAVHSSVTALERQRIYQMFDEGKLDVLTFIGVLTEGWDSNQAKGLINARPTRSLILAKQRLGRITRPGEVGFAIDICDDFDEFEEINPPITVSDALESMDIEAGTVVGDVDDLTRVNAIIESLKATDALKPILESRYWMNLQNIENLPVLHRGVLEKELLFDSNFALASRVNPRYGGVTEQILEKAAKLSGKEISKGLARQGMSIRVIYNVNQAREVLYSLPQILPDKYFTDNKGVKWISSKGLKLLFGKRYPKLTEEVIEEQLNRVIDKLNWIPAYYSTYTRSRRYSHYKVIRMFEVNDETINLLNQTLSEHFLVIGSNN